jgi:O-antigen ligase
MYNKKQTKIQDVFTIVLFVIVLLFTASRKGLLIVSSGWYILLCFRNPKAIIKNTLIYGSVAVIALIVLLNVDFLYDVVGYRLEALFFFFQGQDYEEASLFTRNHYLQYAWENSQDSLFFGHGLDCFRVLPKSYGVYSHNNYLELIFSTGFVGLVIYYSTSLSILFKIPKFIKCDHKVVHLLLAILIPYLLCDFMNVTYFTRRMLVVPAITIMFLGKYANEKKQSVVEKVL